MRTLVKRSRGTERNSAVELLRILCIFGIFTMHSFPATSTARGLLLVQGIFINSLFNSCVSIFELISGFFGVRTSVKKLFRFWIMIAAFSILGLVVNYGFGNVNNSGIIEFLKTIRNTIFPISSVKFWYMTAYFQLMVFADYINLIPEKMERKQFERFLLLLLFVYSICPTITFKNVMNDAGKGFVNMLLMYLIGRYIRLYGAEINVKGKCFNLNTCKTSGLFLLTAAVFIIEFLLNMAVSFVKGGVGIHAPFAMDWSILILLLAICIFMLFQRIHFVSQVVNRIASHMFGAFLAESTARTVVNRFFDVSIYTERWYLAAVIFVYVLATVIVGIILDACYKVTVGRAVDAFLRRLIP